MLWATIRRAPAATAASTRFRVPSVRRRLVGANSSAMRRGLNAGGIAVSSCTTTSGVAAGVRLVRRARHAGYLVPRLDERWHKAPADGAGGAGHEDPHTATVARD